MSDVFTPSNVLCGVATVYTGTAGTAADTHAGYTKDGAEVIKSENANLIFVDNIDAAIKKLTTELEIQIVLHVAEASLANLAIPQANSVTLQVLTLGATSSNENLSLGLVGVNPAGFDRTWEFLQARPRGDLTHNYVKAEIQMVDLFFDILFDSANSIFGTVTDAEA